MDEEQKREIAIFRFGVISDIVSRDWLDRGEQERLIEEQCARQWRIPHSHRTRLSRSTILSWIRAYRRGNRRLEVLMPRDRSDRGRSRALDEDVAQGLLRLRRRMPRASVQQLIAELRNQGLLHPGTRLSQATVYRFLKAHGLMERPSTLPEDRRRFEAEHPNDIWQSDVMHGPTVTVGTKNRQCYLFAFLDDMSRLVPHAQFYFNETLACFLDAFRQALLKRGLPRKLYVDNGAAFRSRQLEEITASLGIALVHSRPYRPEGRGKIERWFRTLRGQFLPGVRATSLAELNEVLDLWIREVYHQKRHSATDTPPLERFAAHLECLRPAPKDLEDFFRKRARRRVNKDRTVSLEGRLYEAPVPLIGKQVTLLYHSHDPAHVEIQLNGLSHGELRPLDLHVNSRVRRQSGRLIVNSEPRQMTSGRLPFDEPEKESR